MFDQPAIVGICGAPCTGKTTLARWCLRKLQRLGLDCELLEEVARILAKQGVAIDRWMLESDYDAFLAGYLARDGLVSSNIAIADRTPVDHFSYIAVNRNVDSTFSERHQDAALRALECYRLLLYLPIEIPMTDDYFRETSPQYQRDLDREISRMLNQVAVPVVKIRGSRRNRYSTALKAIKQAFPELFQVLAAGA
jgi:nicotinamide riboside kinase